MTSSEPPPDPAAAGTAARSGAGVTLRMVAAHAGVSKSVVSRVLQGSPQVSPAKREAVTRAIADLDYRPNTVARSLTQRRTNIVGVLVHDLRQPWFVDALEGVAAGFAPTGLLPFIADGRLDRTLDERVLHSFMDLRLDGLILAGTIPETPLLLQVIERIPSVVLGGRDIDRPTVDVVAQDDAAGVRAALDHLHVLGHRRIHHISGDLGRGFEIRRETYLGWMRLHGLESEARVVLADPSEPGGYQAARELLRDPRTRGGPDSPGAIRRPASCSGTPARAAVDRRACSSATTPPPSGRWRRRGTPRSTCRVTSRSSASTEPPSRLPTTCASRPSTRASRRWPGPPPTC